VCIAKRFRTERFAMQPHTKETAMTNFDTTYLAQRSLVTVRKLKHGYKATHKPTGLTATGINQERARQLAAMRATVQILRK
jgi:hypothetical protein